MATVSELITRVTDSSSGRPVIAALASPGKALGAANINIDSATNWTTGSPIYISIYNTVTVGGITVKDPSTQTDWKGVLAGTTVGSLTLTGGTDREYTAGAIVEQTATSRYAKDQYDFLTSFANTDGTLKAGPIQTALNLGSSSLNGWDVLGATISSVTNNGNRNYDLATPTDTTATLSPGMRLRTTRTVAAPIQCTSLNGTTQYYSKTTPAGMTFTDDFTVSAWVKLSSYAGCAILSRYNATSGFRLLLSSSGLVTLQAHNAGVANYSLVQTYQSLPLNKWVHITAQLDMSTFTATATTSYIMFDGVDVPCNVARGGTNPIALVQAGNLEIGAENSGTNFFPGKIAQAAVFSAKVTQATMRGYMSQGLSGTETSLISAYSFNNSINDLNTTSANNLTAVGSAVATNADSPFGGQAGGTISSTLDYGIVAKVTASTITVNVAEGCTIPTSGGVASVSYSTYKSPFGFPGQSGKWRLQTLVLTETSGVNITTYTNIGLGKLNYPLGEWIQGYTATAVSLRAAATTFQVFTTLSTTSTTESDRDLTAAAVSGPVTYVGGTLSRSKQVSISATTDYYLNFKANASNDFTYHAGLLSPTVIYADNAYL
jgi:hypothetical protein